ncbi:RNA-directed DNA polymerase [Polycyclovorans algicola]|uniref:RNA-directed DNA polymerase n=1 Tax=Polycyclovorans algicola TaxID=616992 RepID=UPI0004A74510|nr:RNA-directed DNA polymerase [Polycyclovorans algicola]
MKRIGGLWPQIIAPENLEAAFRAARRGKRDRDAVARFALNLEGELRRLREQLAAGTWRPGAYRQFTVYDRKPRLISAAPFDDRVVHHALMRVVEPPLDRRMFFHSYACRAGKGVHAAVNQYQRWARHYAYVLKLDVRQYFPSIDRGLLQVELARYLKEAEVLRLFGVIIEQAPLTAAAPAYFAGDDLLTPLAHTRGLPIGNLTSQVLANLYLSRVDHWIAQHHRGGYLRYVDDLIMLGDDKAALWGLQDAIDDQLAGLRLHLHPNKAQVMRSDRKVDVLGYQVSQSQRWLRAENPRRARHRLRRLARGYAAGRLGLDAVRQSVSAWIGHVQHADSWGLRRQMLDALSFSRAGIRA